MKKNKILALLISGVLSIAILLSASPVVLATSIDDVSLAPAVSDNSAIHTDSDDNPGEAQEEATVSEPVSDAEQEPESTAAEPREESDETQAALLMDVGDEASEQSYTPVTIAEQFPDPGMARAIAMELFPWNPSVDTVITEDRIGWTDTLHVYGDDIKDLTDISIFKNLTYLDIGAYDLPTISPEIGELSHLEELHFYNVTATELPDIFGKLTNLQTLVIYRTSIETIPENIGVLSNLRHLTLRESPFSSIPDSIENLHNLEELVIIGGNLDEFPLAVTKLTQLSFLVFGMTGVTTLPEELGNLTNLNSLDLMFNYRLTALPESIGNLTNLNYLAAGSAKLANLPNSIGQLTQLRTLLLGYNQITHLPDSIGNMTGLTELYLGNNKLTELPNSIANLNNLRNVGLNNNQLTKIPMGIFTSPYLDALFLDNNHISVIPEEIANQDFGRMDLSGNAITDFPARVQNMPDATVYYYDQYFERNEGDFEAGSDVRIPLLPIMNQSQNYNPDKGPTVWTLELTIHDFETGDATTVEPLEPLVFDYENGSIRIPKEALEKPGLYQLQVNLGNDNNHNSLFNSTYNFRFEVVTYVDLTFETNGGSPVAAQKVICGRFAEAPADPEKEGFAFAGWFTDQSFDTAWDFTGNVLDTSTTLYAKWEPAAPSSSSSSSPPASSSSQAPSSSSSSTGPSSSSSTPASSAPVSSSSPPIGPVVSDTSAAASSSAPTAPSRPMASSSSVSQAGSSSRAPVSSTAPAPSVDKPAKDSSPPVQDPATPAAAGQASVSNTATTSAQEMENQKVLNTLKENGVPVFQLGGTEIPLYGSNQRQTWALLNVLFALLSIAMAIPTGIAAVRNIRHRNDWTRAAKGKTIAMGGIAVTGLTLALFMTRFAGLMVLTNALTPVFLALFAGQATLLVGSIIQKYNPSLS